jgi:hypothetical protein
MPLLCPRLLIQCWDSDTIADEMLGSLSIDIERAKKHYDGKVREIIKNYVKRYGQQPD